MAAHAAMLKSGVVVMLKELEQDANVLNKYVRVTGTVTYIDKVAKMIQISHDSSVLWVDIALVAVAGMAEHSLVQFIGQINPGSEKIAVATMPYYLQAKVARLVDGLDMRLYEEALKARRAFLSGSGGV